MLVVELHRRLRRRCCCFSSRDRLKWHSREWSSQVRFVCPLPCRRLWRSIFVDFWRCTRWSSRLWAGFCICLPSWAIRPRTNGTWYSRDFVRAALRARRGRCTNRPVWWCLSCSPRRALWIWTFSCRLSSRRPACRCLSTLYRSNFHPLCPVCRHNCSFLKEKNLFF